MSTWLGVSLILWIIGAEVRFYLANRTNKELLELVKLIQREMDQ